jgi:hypothetical protein
MVPPKKYGPATNIIRETDFTKNNAYDVRQRPIATWEDSPSILFVLPLLIVLGSLFILSESMQLNLQSWMR